MNVQGGWGLVEQAPLIWSWKKDWELGVIIDEVHVLELGHESSSLVQGLLL